MFDDTLLAQSAVDRFKNNAFDSESCQPRLKPSIENSPPPAAPVVKLQHPGRPRGR